MRVKGVTHVVVAISLVAPLLFMTGCAKKTIRTDDSATVETPETQSVASQQPEIPEYRPPQAPMGTEEPLESTPYVKESRYPVLEGRSSGPMLPVYFDFDRSNIRSDQRQRLIGNAEFMKNNANLTVRIEGNCDERGTNEYNIALGERRANSAKKFLINLGINERRIKTISYGEERPLNYGHDELSWSQNRRDDFVVVE